jgi:hypothetical protein
MTTHESGGLPEDQTDPGDGKTVDPTALNIRVNGASRKETNQLIGELQAFLQERTEAVQFERQREDPTAMDAGTLLVAVLPVVVELAKVAGPALKELAKGISDWMRKRNVSVVVDGIALEGPPDKVEEVLQKLLLARH